MHLTPHEIDKLALHQAGSLAQKRLARGVRLNYPEAVALISAQVLELVRDGRSVAELMDVGRQLLGRADVMDQVPEMIVEVQVEGTFPDGSKLVTVHHPIVAEFGNLELALYGSFLPVPERHAAGLKAGPTTAKSAGLKASPTTATGVGPGSADVGLGSTGVGPGSTGVGPGSTGVGPGFSPAVPGEFLLGDGDIVINEGRKAIQLSVTNHGDRPIQVGSHYHFSETNRALRFDREAASGRRLDIPAGTAVRFEPGESKTVALVEIAGNRIARGGVLPEGERR